MSMMEMMGRMDPTAQELIDSGVPMTSPNYLDARFDGDVPEEVQHESQLGLPPELQGFSGVGLSETPQGPLPIPEGRMGISPAELAQAPQVKLGKAQQVPQLEQPPAKRTSPLEPDQPIGEGSRFKQFNALKPPQGNQ